MTDETIVAVYDTTAHAEAAIADLQAAGVPDSAISRHAEAGGVSAVTTGARTAAGAPMREPGFWATLFGGEPDHDTAVYDRCIEGGSTIVSVRAPEAHQERILEILESHHPVDIDDRATGYGLTQAARPAPAPAPAAAADTIQLAEESLTVGKRVVNRGGTRIRRFVVETPVEQTVTLHSEKVMLDRRPVTDGRPLTGAAFTDKTIEMTETAEEAVVSKTARLIEEITLRKQAADRVETVRDTVRREDVEIVRIPGDAKAVDPRAPKV